jgi:hypothetical protein
MKIGIIQVQRFGDLLIALPIAAWYAARGHEVYWPVYTAYYAAIQSAAPEIHFLPHDLKTGARVEDSLYRQPLSTLEGLECDRIFSLDAIFDYCDPANIRLLCSLKFDEYKYAVARVPFTEKWTLSLQRDLGREKALYYMLGISRSYICIHAAGSGGSNAPLVLPAAWESEFQIVHIRELTDNPLDWIYTIEHAAKRIMVDSMFANLTEQLNITGENYLITRSIAGMTPVYQNGWIFCEPGQPIPAENHLQRKRAL